MGNWTRRDIGLLLSAKLRITVLLAFVPCTTHCDSREAQRKRVFDLRAGTAVPEATRLVEFTEPAREGLIIYRGVNGLPKSAANGDVLRLTHYFEVKKPFHSDFKIFVHGEQSDGTRILVADHSFASGRVALPIMNAGETWRDEQSLHLPEKLEGEFVSLWLGFFENQVRARAAGPPGTTDGRNRALVGRLPLRGEREPKLPTAVVRRTRTPIVVDGVLDEAAWKDAEVLRFSDSLGKRAKRQPTALKLLYDDHRLYVGFTASDRDITDKAKKRDDPIYEHEAVELFLMPGVQIPNVGPYIELQASPSGVVFDASFEARRRGMDRSYSARMRVATEIRGTLNDPAPDTAWISEWSVELDSIVRRGQPRPQQGTEWRMNAFRVDRQQNQGRVIREYTAWSPPRVGDFHAVRKFGRLVFD